jgi:hypothetical protein
MMQAILSREALWTAAAPSAAFENVIQIGGCATALHSDFVAKERLPNRVGFPGACRGYTAASSGSRSIALNVRRIVAGARVCSR